jgi:hypothetical protein
MVTVDPFDEEIQQFGELAASAAASRTSGTVIGAALLLGRWPWPAQSMGADLEGLRKSTKAGCVAVRLSWVSVSVV